MAHIVNHLDKVIDVDDELLVYLHEMRGERKQVGALHAAFQSDRLPVVSYHHLPSISLRDYTGRGRHSPYPPA